MKKNNPTTIQRRCAVVPRGVHVRETKEGEEPSREITGYAILFNEPSEPLYDDGEEEWREIITPEAVTRELLDACDIKFTMYHDRQILLARSNHGQGTLHYDIDERGVSFRFEAPRTPDGDTALELVRRGDITGCSFAFSTHYYNPAFVRQEVTREGDKTYVRCYVLALTGIYDFTLAADPAYPATSVSARREAEPTEFRAIVEAAAAERARVQEETDRATREAEWADMERTIRRTRADG